MDQQPLQPDLFAQLASWLRGIVITAAVAALAGVWQSFRPAVAMLITALVLVLAGCWVLRTSFAVLLDWVRGIESAPPTAPARTLAHKSEPLPSLSISIPVPAAPAGPLVEDNPFAPAVETPGHVGALQLHAIADADNLLIVGAKGSGKTTVLRALLRLRHGEHLSLDPHNAPHKWPCKVVGGGRDFAAIDSILQGTYLGLNRRYKQLNSGEVSEGQFRRHTLVGDEWRAISQELPGERAKDSKPAKMSAGEVLIKVLTEGRKVGLCMLAAAHNDTAGSMGMAGDMAILTCFDWIVYLGALAVRKLPEAAKMSRPAVAYHPERDQYFLLDVSGAAQLAGPIAQPARPQTDPELQQSLLEVVVPPGVVPASQGGGSAGSGTGSGTSSNVVPADTAALEPLIRRMAEQKMSRNQIAAILGGNRQKALELIRHVLGDQTA
jgi:energy-coupling factor transporter ATP-binding protein EcfA2